ncbi:MAG: hypothetical protein IJC15_04825, partial [Clostridia bacterium]|nr:hypothetical protein [Clostridia bacterium]
ASPAAAVDSPPAVVETTALPETTAAPETEVIIPANRIPTVKGSIKHAEAGLRPFTVISSDRLVAEGEASKFSTYIYGYSDGTATLTFTDCFGHTATCDVTVRGEEITLTPHKPAEDFIEVTLDYGANGYDIADDTAAIQKALDAAKPGETVYLYPGTYVTGRLVMREGVTLEMYTAMTDATAGLTDELAKQIGRGEITVLSGAKIMNNAYNQPGAEGTSGFTIRGGAITPAAGSLIFTCADSVLLENIILTESGNSHTIQLAGCTATTLRNCLFAGYKMSSTFTREVVQIEAARPNAIGEPPNAPLTFEEGEFHYCKAIEIDHCYFGKSDKTGAPLIAIGHHGQHGDANVTGLRVTNTVFDEMLYAGIRFANIVDVEISGNTFISTAAYPNVNHAQAANPACISIYSPSSATTYTSVVSGQKITHATVEEQSGTHNLRISDNTFHFGEGADKRILHMVGTGYQPGLIYHSGTLRQKAYNTAAYRLYGYAASTNFIDDVTFTGNTIRFDGQPTYRDHFFYVQMLNRLTVEGNTVEAPAEVTFSSESRELNGFRILGRESEDYIISTGPRGNILLKAPDGTITMKARQSFTVKIKAEAGGHLLFSDDGEGNGIITPVPDDGFVFAGLYTPDGSRITEDYTITAAVTLTARFTAK